MSVIPAISAHPEARDPDFFVVGLQKSGSYWVTPLLNAHPEIRCFPHMYGEQTGVGEGRVFDMLASIDSDGGKAFRHSFLNYHGGFFADLVPLLDKVSREELFARFRDRYREWFVLHNPERRSLVGDKTTEYIFTLDLIDDFYPRAKKLCIMRDPKDRVVSWHFHQIRKGRKPAGEVRDGFVKEYVEERVMHEYECMLAYTGHIHIFTYEMLSRDAKCVLTRALEYLGAATAGELIDVMIREGDIQNLRRKDKLDAAARASRREDVLPRSHYRRGVVGDWKNHLTSAQAAWIDERTGSLQAKIHARYGVVTD